MTQFAAKWKAWKDRRSPQSTDHSGTASTYPEAPQEPVSQDQRNEFGNASTYQDAPQGPAGAQIPVSAVNLRSATTDCKGIFMIDECRFTLPEKRSCTVNFQNRGKGAPTWQLSLGGNPHSCTLTLTTPERRAFGTLSFDGEGTIGVITDHDKLEGEGLFVEALTDITLPPVKMNDRLSLRTTSGTILCPDTEAAQYSFQSVRGLIDVKGKYPQKDSFISQSFGTLKLELFGGSSVQGAEIFIGHVSGKAVLNFKGFNGTLFAELMSGSTTVNRPGQKVLTWQQRGEERVTIGNGGPDLISIESTWGNIKVFFT